VRPGLAVFRFPTQSKHLCPQGYVGKRCADLYVKWRRGPSTGGRLRFPPPGTKRSVRKKCRNGNCGRSGYRCTSRADRTSTVGEIWFLPSLARMNSGNFLPIQFSILWYICLYAVPPDQISDPQATDGSILHPAQLQADETAGKKLANSAVSGVTDNRDRWPSEHFNARSQNIRHSWKRKSEVGSGGICTPM